MRRITGKAEDETLIELRSATDSQSTGKQLGGGGGERSDIYTLFRLVFSFFSWEVSARCQRGAEAVVRSGARSHLLSFLFFFFFFFSSAAHSLAVNQRISLSIRLN